MMMEVYFPHLFERVNKIFEQSESEVEEKWVVFDFDGVCSRYAGGWKGKDVFEEPIEGVAELTKELREAGFKTLLATTRANTPKLKEYIKEHGFEFDAINSSAHNPPDSDKFKPIGELYIDDRGLHFDPENSQASIEQIKSRLGIGSTAKESKINEMQDTPIISITRVVDDDTGIWANDEFEFALHADYRDSYKGDKEACKRLADELRSVADMIEKDRN